MTILRKRGFENYLGKYLFLFTFFTYIYTNVSGYDINVVAEIRAYVHRYWLLPKEIAIKCTTD